MYFETAIDEYDYCTAELLGKKLEGMM